MMSHLSDFLSHKEFIAVYLNINNLLLSPTRTDNSNSMVAIVTTLYQLALLQLLCIKICWTPKTIS